MISVLNSVSQLGAENALSSTQASLQKTLQQLSTGLKINSGSDDAAGLSIASGLGASISALTQSSQNASNSVGLLQTADGALSQVTSLLNRAVTLATEAANGGLTSAQSDAANTEYNSILGEIDAIGANTNFNGSQVFSATALSTFTGDGTAAGDATTSTSIGSLTSATTLSLTKDALKAGGTPQTELEAITTAIDTVSSLRGTIGASVNQLTADSNVENTQVTNLTSAQNNVQNADISSTVAKMTQYNVLEQTGMAALSQSNQAQQAVLKLLQ
ncbi:MAG: flagellin [Terracidiphilus sp.]